jgi:hypothetical protein
MFTAPLPANRSIVPRVSFCGNVFSDPLPSNGHGADHTENNSCSTFSFVPYAYFGRWLEIGVQSGDDVGGMFPRNVDTHVPGYMASHPRML